MKNVFDPEQAVAEARREFGEHGGVSPSIERSSTFTVMEPGAMPEIFSGKRGPDRGGCYLYSRHFNPTVDVLDRYLAAMEGTEFAVSTASGMSAIVCTLLQLCHQGDHIVASNMVYGNPLFPAIRSAPTAVSRASRRKQIPSSRRRWCSSTVTASVRAGGSYSKMAIRMGLAVCPSGGTMRHLRPCPCPFRNPSCWSCRRAASTVLGSTPSSLASCFTPGMTPDRSPCSSSVRRCEAVCSETVRRRKSAIRITSPNNGEDVNRNLFCSARNQRQSER